METFGARFTRLRKEKGFTQEDIATKFNISAQAVSKWENDLTCPDISILLELADMLGVTVDELLGRKKEDITKFVESKDNFDVNKLTLKIKMISGDGDKLNVNLPIPLIKLLISQGLNLSDVTSDKKEKLKDIDLNKILSLVDQGVLGELVNIESADNDKIVVVVE